MHRVWPFLLCLAAWVQLAGCAGDGAADSPPLAGGRQATIPDEVRLELVRLGVEDQEPRQELTAERMQDTAFARSMLRGDSARTARLQEIVQEYGWPDSVRVGGEAAQAAFLILQHSPVHEFQQEMLPVVEDLAMKGSMPRGEVAMLIDRVLMHGDLSQRYGTQFTLVDGRWVLHPVEDEVGLDERRKAVGLPTMEEYMRLMEEFTKTPVVR